LVTLFIVSLLTPQAGAVPAFPGAEGYGANATGGRGGDVYHVTSLADTSTPGTLRYGIKNAPAGGRTIVFDISGTITLTSTLKVDKSKITIAGQTAPGQGISLKNYQLTVSGNDLIIRHIRSRLGTDAYQEADTIGITGGNNVILDHCSASWSVDETLSASDTSTTLTVQYCYITESLNDSIHSKGPHGYGSLLRPDVNAWYSFHHNLYAHHNSRNPRPGTYNNSLLALDFRNNVIYDWGDQAGYSGNDGNEYVNMNYVGNYLVAGPSTDSGELTDAFQGGSTDTWIYQLGNLIDGNRDGVFDGVDTGWGMFSGSYTMAPGGTAFAVPAVSTDAADLAIYDVLNQAGAFFWDRDGVDARITSEVVSGTGHIIDAVSEVGGFPTYPMVTRPVDFDTDLDGMPNLWELAYGLNPNIADNNGDLNGDGYTNLEEYLNEVAIPEPASLSLLAAGGLALLRRKRG
jgi:pectate lyase